MSSCGGLVASMACGWLIFETFAFRSGIKTGFPRRASWLCLIRHTLATSRRGPRLLQGELSAARLHWRAIECPPTKFDKTTLLCSGKEITAAEADAPPVACHNLLLKSHAAMSSQPIHEAANEADVIAPSTPPPRKQLNEPTNLDAPNPRPGFASRAPRRAPSRASRASAASSGP